MRILKSKAGKWILGILAFFILVFLFLAYSFRLIAVEDRYGDLQDIYWKSEDGDIVFNKLNSTSAIIEKDWHRMYVRINGKLIHVDEFLDPSNKYNFDVEIYRPNEILNGKNISKIEIENGIRNSSIEFIAKLKVKY